MNRGVRTRIVSQEPIIGNEREVEIEDLLLDIPLEEVIVGVCIEEKDRHATNVCSLGRNFRTDCKKQFPNINCICCYISSDIEQEHLLNNITSLSPTTAPSHRSSYKFTEQFLSGSVHPSAGKIVRDSSDMPSGRNTPTHQPSNSPTFEQTQQQFVGQIPNLEIISRVPTDFVSLFPSSEPTVKPSRKQLTTVPSIRPSSSPLFKAASIITDTTTPIASPSLAPLFRSSSPSRAPSGLPTLIPSLGSSITTTPPPTSLFIMSSAPTIIPTNIYSSVPSIIVPTSKSSLTPSQVPTNSQIHNSSIVPSSKTSNGSTNNLTTIPSPELSLAPTVKLTPYKSSMPSLCRTHLPTTIRTLDQLPDPSLIPLEIPTEFSSTMTITSSEPSVKLSQDPTDNLTLNPSALSTSPPSLEASSKPSLPPTSISTYIPSNGPSQTNEDLSSHIPSFTSSLSPSRLSTDLPSLIPSSMPHFQLSQNPTVAKTINSSIQPLFSDSQTPSINKSVIPTLAPTSKHFSPGNFLAPSQLPIQVSSLEPTEFSSMMTITSSEPSVKLSQDPTDNLTLNPSALSTSPPSLEASSKPSLPPTSISTYIPSNGPSQTNEDLSSHIPSFTSSLSPSRLSTDLPSLIPSSLPHFQPSQNPTVAKTINSSIQPLFNDSQTPSSHVPLLASSVQSQTPTAFSSYTLSSLPSLKSSRASDEFSTFVQSSGLSTVPTLSPSSEDSLTLFTQTHLPSLRSSFPTNTPQEDLSAFPTSRWLKLFPSSIPISPPSSSIDKSFHPSFLPVVLSTKPSEPRNLIFPTTYSVANATFVFVGNFTYLLPEKDISTFEDITAELLRSEKDYILGVSMFSQDISLKSSKSRHYRLKSLSPQDDAGNWTASLFIKSSRALTDDDLYSLSVLLTTNTILYTDRLTNVLPNFFNQIANSSESFTFNFLSISSNIPTKAPSTRPSPSFSSSRVSNMPTTLSSMITQGSLAAMSAAVRFTYNFEPNYDISHFKMTLL